MRASTPTATPAGSTIHGTIQEAYGVSKDEAEKQVSTWQETQKDTDARK